MLKRLNKGGSATKLSLEYGNIVSEKQWLMIEKKKKKRLKQLSSA